MCLLLQMNSVLFGKINTNYYKSTFFNVVYLFNNII